MLKELNPEAIKSTIFTYNKIVNCYSECWSNDERMHNMLQKFLTLLPERSFVVDIGCGTGRDVKYLIDYGVDAIGIDLSIGMLKEAKRIIPVDKFIIMDMRTLGLPSEMFNGIWACASVIHIPKYQIEMVLKGFYRILKRDGILFLAMQEGENELFMPDGRFYAYYKREEIKRLLQKYNFQIIDFESNESQKNTFNGSKVIKWINFYTKKI